MHTELLDYAYKKCLFSGPFWLVLHLLDSRVATMLFLCEPGACLCHLALHQGATPRSVETACKEIAASFAKNLFQNSVFLPPSAD